MLTVLKLKLKHLETKCVFKWKLYSCNQTNWSFRFPKMKPLTLLIKSWKNLSSFLELLLSWTKTLYTDIPLRNGFPARPTLLSLVKSRDWCKVYNELKDANRMLSFVTYDLNDFKSRINRHILIFYIFVHIILWVPFKQISCMLSSFCPSFSGNCMTHRDCSVLHGVNSN